MARTAGRRLGARWQPRAGGSSAQAAGRAGLACPPVSSGTARRSPAREEGARERPHWAVRLLRLEHPQPTAGAASAGHNREAAGRPRPASALRLDCITTHTHRAHAHPSLSAPSCLAHRVKICFHPGQPVRPRAECDGKNTERVTWQTYREGGRATGPSSSPACGRLKHTIICEFEACLVSCAQ